MNLASAGAGVHPAFLVVIQFAAEKPYADCAREVKKINGAIQSPYK